jgi:hypothetical protein
MMLPVLDVIGVLGYLMRNFVIPTPCELIRALIFLCDTVIILCFENDSAVLCRRGPLLRLFW